MFILGWLPRVITVDSRLINFTEGPISCIASDTSQQLQKGDFMHRSCLRSPGLGRKQPFSFHCSSPRDPDIYKSNPAVLTTALAFFNGTLFIFCYQLPWQIWNSKFSCICNTLVILHHVTHLMGQVQGALLTTTRRSLDLSSLNCTYFLGCKIV